MANVEVSREVTATNVLRNAYPDAVWQVSSETINATWTAENNEIQLAFKMGAFPASYAYKALVGAYLKLTASSPSTFYNYGRTWSLGDYTAASLTWNTRPVVDQTSELKSLLKSSGSVKSFSIGGTADSLNAYRLAKAAGILFTTNPYSANDVAFFYTQAAGTAAYKPSVVFIVDDSITVSSQVVQQNSPTGGRVNRNAAQTFAWTFQRTGDYYCAGDFTQQSATFYWKLSTDSSYTAVAASGSTQSVTIAANTFPSGTIQWYVTATDSAGATTSTPVYSFNTADATMNAYPESPSAQIVDGSQPIVFRWSTASDYGSAPSGSQLAYRVPDGAWTNIATLSSSSALSYTVAANTLPAGSLEWRVRAKNQDGVYGPWSSAVAFVNIAASPAPALLVTARPFATISWSSTDQQAYRIRIDGELIGTFFGTEKTYQMEDAYLEDGEHTASVEVQNVYGMWSEPGETTFIVSNAGGQAAPSLSAEFGIDAELFYTTATARSLFYIYRDGELIGKTTELAWTDRLTLGTHSYYVVRRIMEGTDKNKYGKSVTLTGTLAVDGQAISLASGGSWLALRLSEYSDGERSFSYTRTHSLRHITAAKLPFLELSPYEDQSGSYNCAFSDPDQAAMLEAMRGKVVIVKSRGGNVVVGLLATLEKRVGDFYTSFTFSVQRIQTEGLT